ncbi:MAG TPA: hypothetical protein VFN25_03020 [Dokdonella sp.]|uniref:hypothetical protein n=1 Tax=Dokdonella sp. TaxID=2291710 RepID=UPI002D7E74C6|nr:hypothetical protein [Dokdonella sp.]HET9031857.1 hypothetical protein [Dokdonella sp.]
MSVHQHTSGRVRSARPHRRFSRILLATALSLAAAPAFAIFTNGGFEQNSFVGWTLAGGTNPGLLGAEPFTSASIQITPGAPGPASIVGQMTDLLAPTILLPRVGQLTAKLNDENGGALVTSLVQTDTVTSADIDPADGLPHIRFAFAPVMDDPNHSPNQQPYFYVSVKNLADNSILFEQFAYSGQAGVNFLSGAGNWKYLEFQNIDVVLPLSAVGEQVELTVIAADCSLGGHGGYVYVDGFGSSNVPPPGNAAVITEVPVNQPAILVLLASLLGLIGFRAARAKV